MMTKLAPPSRIAIAVALCLTVGASESLPLLAQQGGAVPPSTGPKVTTDPSGMRIEVVHGVVPAAETTS